MTAPPRPPGPCAQRPPAGAAVEVVVGSGGQQAHSRVADSQDQELVLEVATDQAGRRIRLPLGIEVSVWWTPPDAPLRFRRYQVLDVRGGSVPTWRLRPLGDPADGDRRGAPRAPLHVPVGLALPSGMLLGETLDVSESGLRAVFAAAPTAGFGEIPFVLPDVGERATMALLLADTRVEVGCRVVHRERLPDGRRTFRVAFEELPTEVRARVRTATALELAQRAARSDPGARP